MSLQQNGLKMNLKTIQNLLDDAISKFGEAITIRRFSVGILEIYIVYTSATLLVDIYFFS